MSNERPPLGVKITIKNKTKEDYNRYSETVSKEMVQKYFNYLKRNCTIRRGDRANTVRIEYLNLESFETVLGLLEGNDEILRVEMEG